ncbi:exodeoxyribonuclease VII small subunit [Candidatus Ichthyocystis hellenicum]|uniref:Exodeoxyribonuclease 7 small subunit n=2 Tax=Burkholderiales genera incertae sedis TaxID=224471 RepID=A0A0S4LZA9_9BURK|nr:exodeoxyribonuclease VII small subunit [Candidatus Ichthyocystis hellenicum]CUT16905.1 exodeoxyribonuclease VII small subunit [Candidatus Ichthyocystis hellenicum]
MPKEKSQQPPLDQMLNDLENLVVELEEGKLSLEQSMAAFTKGCDIVRQCQNVLNETEKAIKVLDEQMQSLRIMDNNELES